MADNVAITAGSGTSIATDEVSGTLEHVQIFKLAVSADGSRALVPADATNGILVDVSRIQGSLPAGSNTLGFVGITDGSNSLVVDTAHNDGESTTENHVDVAAKLMGYNGTTWDRLRSSIANGLQVDVTRITGSIPAGSNLIGTVGISDGINAVVVDTTPADNESASTASLVTNARLKLFNGTGWDRMRGDITNGLDVDVTRVKPDGTNTMPSLDTVARSGYVRITDGTSVVGIDTVHNDGESATENHLMVGARISGLNQAGTFDTIRASVSTNKAAQYTAAQTGTALWTPAAGKAVVITALQIQAGGTTAGAVQVWFGGAADTAYTRGTDAALFDGEFAPSATNKPGIFVTLPTPIRGTADFVLRVTSSAAINPLTVSVWGYEI